MEFAPGFARRATISHVLFDFDGTLSLIRQGWPEIMTPMFAEMLPPLPGETLEARLQLCNDDIMRLNGKQTIYQMIQLAERIKERGGTPREPLWYKHEYLAAAGGADKPPVGGPAQRVTSSRMICWFTARARCWRSLKTPRPAALPGQRHRRVLREGGGRTARYASLLWPAHLRRH